jgi:glucokinase
MYRIGIDLGGTNIAAGLVNEQFQIADKCSVKTNVPRSVESIVADMVQMAEALLERNHLTWQDVTAVGVGVPCTANQGNGHMEDADNLGFEDVPFLSLLSEKVPVPVFFENDANAAAWGEYWGGGYHEDSFIMVTLGTGIGGGIILNGKLWAGINGAAAEFGHMTIDYAGVPCNCGRRGCFEAMASATALIRRAREQMKEHPESLLWQLCDGDLTQMEAKTVFDGAAAKDETALKLLDTYTTYLAEGITNIINIFQPAVVCVGGGVSRAGNALLLPLREKSSQRIYSRNAKRNTRIELAQLGNDAGILGAALLGRADQLSCERQVYKV